MRETILLVPWSNIVVVVVVVVVVVLVLFVIVVDRRFRIASTTGLNCRKYSETPIVAKQC